MLRKLFNKDILILGLISLVFAYGVNVKDIYISIGCILLLLALNVVFSFKKIKERIVFLIFQITFFTFLIGRLLIYYLFPDLFIFAFVFSDYIMMHILMSLFLSLIFVRLGYAISETANYKGKIKEVDYRSRYNMSVRKIARILMYLTLLPRLIIVAEKAIHVGNLGYEAYYTDFASDIPFIILKLGFLYEPLTYLFLATMPPKKECKLPLFMFFLVGCFSLSYGQRNGFILNSIFVLLYLFIRNQIYSGGVVWFKRRYALLVIAMLPFLFTFLLAFGSIRSGEGFHSSSMSNNTLLFFFSQGNSASLIGLAQKYKDSIPENKFYSFGPVISFLEENAIAKAFFNVPQYQKMSPEQALNGRAFSFTISYLQNPAFYMRGGALGSCYIAELWVDFGYIGVALGSLILGILMAKFIPYCRYNIWLTTIAFSGVMAIIYAPRAEFSGFIHITLSFVNLLTFAFIHLLGKNSLRLPPQILEIKNSKKLRRT
ncbi:MAG: O-antigen polysaccharide polymerase Wzy family protein [Deltaproteobacteria bacterium]|nr:O-antigen polysaccharide polymerase Wzy family protein [Deltaproteobacteria bacterium]